MRLVVTGLLLAGFTTFGSAHADVVYSNTLQNINGSYGSSTATTTSDNTGTRTSVVGTGAGDPNRASGTSGYNQWYQANVGPGGTVGITSDYARDGNGSAFFSTVGGNGKADLQYYPSASVALSSLTSVSFDFYRDGSSTTGAQYAPVLRLDIYKNTTYAGSLVFEDFYQAQSNPAVNTWTTLTANLNQGIFWATNANLGPTFAAAVGGQKTLQAWIDANAGSTLSVVGLSIGVGSGWNDSFTGAVDDVSAVFAGQTVTANFEVSPAASVPEPASLMLTAAGLGALALIRRRQV